MNTAALLAAHFGMPIYESTLAVTLASGRVLPRKAWHDGRCYSARIVKKWVKRFGPATYKPAVFAMTDPTTGRRVLAVHPALMPELRKALSGRDYTNRVFR